MPSDFATPHGPLRAIIEATLRDDILILHGGVAQATPQLPGSIARICADAKRRRLRVEQLLVLVKEIWLTVPAGRNGFHDLQSRDALAEIITTTINCYYAD